MYNEIYLPRHDISEKYNPNQSNNNITIDEDDLYIIYNTAGWDPPDEIVLAYARKLGFDIINDPPELLEIARKYLLKPLPPNMVRAFLKETLEILYIKETTGDRFREIELDSECKKEYEEEKEKIQKEKNNKKKKKKGKRKKNKKSTNKDNNDDNTTNEEDKKKILDKKKLKLKEYKEKLKLKYIENKTKVIKNINDEYDIKIYSEKNKIKNDLENEIIKPVETRLKQDYDNSIQKYKKELKEKYEQDFLKDKINTEYTGEINELNIKVKILQNQIVKQKEQKEEKIKEEKNKIEKVLNLKKNEFDEKYKKKFDELNSINEKKILKLKNEFNEKYKSYIEQYEFNYNKNNFNINNNINLESHEMKEKNNLILKKTNELFKENKNKIEKEFEDKLNEEISKYKNDIIKKNKKEQDEINNELFIIEQKYNEEMENFLKKQKNENNRNLYINEANKINEKINIIYTPENISKGINELLNHIKEIYDEEEAEEYITEKNNELFFKLIKIKSFYDISEKDYMKYLCEIEYYKEIINLIIKNIVDNKNDKNEISLINNLIKKCTEIINKHKEKYKEEINKKLFPLLEKEFNEISNKKKEGNKYIKNSFFEQSSKNAINTTIILDNFRNIVFNTNRNNKIKNNINVINNSSLNNFNKTFNKNMSLSNRNPILSNNNISFLNKDKSKNNLNNNKYINQNIQTNRSNYNNFNLNKTTTSNKNDFTYVNMASNYIKNIPDNNSMIRNEENINNNLNINLELNNVQILNENIKQNLSQENKDICNQIQNFFKKEYNSINEKINELKNTNYINNQLNSLKESSHLKKYGNIFSNIFVKEQKKSEDISNNILQSKTNLDKVRKECNSIFNQINSGLISPEYINSNFQNIINKINDYNNINNNHLRKSSSLDNKYINYRYNINYDKIKKIKVPEENKEDDNNINYTTFPLFCNSYRPNYLSEKINNTFSHNFFNYKKNYNDIKFSLISSNLI